MDYQLCCVGIISNLFLFGFYLFPLFFPYRGANEFNDMAFLFECLLSMSLLVIFCFYGCSRIIGGPG